MQPNLARKIFATFVAALAVIGTTPALAGRYVYQTVDLPGGDTEVADVNDLGVAVGSGGAAATPFRFAGGVATPLDIPYRPGGLPVTVGAVNDSGRVLVRYERPNIPYSLGLYGIRSGNLQRFPTLPHRVGSKLLQGATPVAVGKYNAAVGAATYAGISGSVVRGWLYRPGQADLLTLFDAPGTPFYTAPADITLDGSVVVGTTIQDEYSDSRGFVLQGGVFETFAVPGSVSTEVLSIGAGGVIAGSYIPDTGGPVIYGFAKAGDRYTSFAFPSGVAVGPGSVFATRVIRMLPHGQAVGSYTVVRSPPPYGTRAFTYAGGQYYDVSVAGAVDTVVNRVNRFGSLAGYWVDGGGKHHGFVALCTPDQVPCTQ